MQSASHPEISEAIRTLSRESFDPALDAAFKKAGLRSHLYHFLIDRPGQPNDKPLITAGGNYAGIARNTFGLYGAVSYLIETRGIGLGREHWQRRVGAHVLAASALIRTAATNVEALRRANAAARNGWTGDITVDYESRREVREVPVIDALTGEDRNLRVDFINTLQVTPSIRRSIPVGYILGPDQEAAAQRLAQHGLRVVRLFSATDANVERFSRRAAGRSTLSLRSAAGARLMQGNSVALAVLDLRDPAPVARALLFVERLATLRTSTVQRCINGVHGEVDDRTELRRPIHVALGERRSRPRRSRVEGKQRHLVAVDRLQLEIEAEYGLVKRDGPIHVDHRDFYEADRVGFAHMMSGSGQVGLADPVCR